MEAANKLKINASKMGAELIRAERKLQAIEESMQMAFSVLMTIVDNVKMAKEQIRRSKDTCHVINAEVKEMEERARMEKTLSDDFIFEEEEEGVERNEEEEQCNEGEQQSGTEGLQQDESMNETVD